MTYNASGSLSVMLLDTGQACDQHPTDKSKVGDAGNDSSQVGICLLVSHLLGTRCISSQITMQRAVATAGCWDTCSIWGCSGRCSLLVAHEEHALVLWKMVGPKQVSRPNSWRLKRRASAFNLVSRCPGSMPDVLMARPAGPFSFLGLGLLD